MEGQMDVRVEKDKIYVRNGSPRWGRPIFHDGEVYPSIAKAARAFKINEHSLYTKAYNEKNLNTRWATEEEVRAMRAKYNRGIRPLKTLEAASADPTKNPSSIKRIVVGENGSIRLNLGYRARATPIFYMGKIYASGQEIESKFEFHSSKLWNLLKRPTDNLRKATLEECVKEWPNVPILWDNKAHKPETTESAFDDKSSVTEAPPETPPEVSLYTFVAHAWEDNTITIHVPGKPFTYHYQSMEVIPEEIKADCKFE